MSAPIAQAPVAEPETLDPRAPTGTRTRNMWWALVWLGVPLLAVVAYVTVLRVGFLSDDYVLLNQPWTHGFDLGMLLPHPEWAYWRFYRPTGWLVTWEMGWVLWGLDPLPYHVIGLLLHAGVSLFLGLFVAEVTGKRWLGWLAGALFAVFPLHTEAVGWLAAQWDLWAAFFGLLSLWLFTRWWRNRSSSWALYGLSLACYALGLLGKETLITFLPVFALSAWLVGVRRSRSLPADNGLGGQGSWRNLLVSMVPFCVMLVLYVIVRYATWHDLGNYPWARKDYWNFFWDATITHAQLLLSPLNPSVFGSAPVQILGAVSTLALLVGITWFGRSHWRLLLLAGAWILLTLFPVLNLAVRADDLENNRFLYLVAAGYCV